MKNCLCGAPIEPDSEFCENCGIRLQEEPVFKKSDENTSKENFHDTALEIAFSRGNHFLTKKDKTDRTINFQTS